MDALVEEFAPYNDAAVIEAEEGGADGDDEDDGSNSSGGEDGDNGTSVGGSASS